MNIFQNQTLQEEKWKLSYIYLIMQQKPIKNATRVYISAFNKKTDLANLISNVDKLDIDK